MAAAWTGDTDAMQETLDQLTDDDDSTSAHLLNPGAQTDWEALHGLEVSGLAVMRVPKEV